jgi:hypothetical protein
MEQEAHLRDRTTHISAKELKPRKAPQAPGTPSDLRDLVAAMLAAYKTLFGPQCPALPALARLQALLRQSITYHLSRPHLLPAFMLETAPAILSTLHQACVTFFHTRACEHHLASQTGLPIFKLNGLLSKLESNDRFFPRDPPAAVFYCPAALPYRTDSTHFCSPASTATPPPGSASGRPQLTSAPTASQRTPHHYHAPTVTSTSSPSPQPNTSGPHRNNAYPTPCHQAIIGWKAANNWAATRNIPLEVLAQAIEIPPESLAPLMGLSPRTCQIYLLSGECNSPRCQRPHPPNVTLPQTVAAHLTQHLPATRPPPSKPRASAQPTRT